MTGRALLLVNTHSRRGAEAAGETEAALVQAGLTVIRHDLPRGTDVPALIARHAAEVDRVVMGGGDGTLNAAAPGILAAGLPLGIIPLGTANDLARTLAIPTDIARAADIIAAGRTQRVDLGEVNGHLFFNVASIGLGVDLTRALTRDSKKRWGVLGYAIAGLRVLGRLAPFRAIITESGTTHVSRTIHISVGNGRHYGGGMTISEDARIDDGRLDVYSLEVDSAWSLLPMLPALRRGRHHAWEAIRTLAGDEIEIRTSRPRSVNTDGEIATRTPARFRVRRAALEVFVP